LSDSSGLSDFINSIPLAPFVAPPVIRVHAIAHEAHGEAPRCTARATDPGGGGAQEFSDSSHGRLMAMPNPRMKRRREIVSLGCGS